MNILNMLKTDVEEFNEYRKKNPDLLVDLSNADFSGADLHRANLRYADISYANLSGASLSYADLSEANLGGADIDFSVLPLWCGGRFKADERILKQLQAHVIAIAQDSGIDLPFEKLAVEYIKGWHREKEFRVKTKEMQDET